MEFFSQRSWCSLSVSDRQTLANIYKLKKTEGNHVENGVLVSDGISSQELMKMNVSAMQKYTNTNETDLKSLVLLSLAKYASGKKEGLSSNPPSYVERKRKVKKSSRKRATRPLSRKGGKGHDAEKDLQRTPQSHQERGDLRGSGETAGTGEPDHNDVQQEATGDAGQGST